MPEESAMDQKTDKKGLTNSEVMSIENHLEISPSQHDASHDPNQGHKFGRHLSGDSGGFGKKSK
jgi:hypothetical protein